MNKIKIVILTFIVVCLNLNAEEIIISQGDTKVTFDDIDGFAFRMPNDIRKKYFSDIERIEKLLDSMLNYKHIYNYNNKNKLIDPTVLTKRIDTRVSKLFAYDDSTDALLEKQSMFSKIKQFLILDETYKLVQEFIVSSINEDSLEEFAKEKYTFNKNDYQIPETRTIRYLSFKKDSKNLEGQKIEINKNIKKLLNNELKFDQIPSLYSEKKDKVILSNILENITYDKKSPSFSKFIYSVSNLGIINDILETKEVFLIAKIIQINPARLATFSEVKDMLISDIKNDKFTREFTKLLLGLTKDTVDINQTNLKSLLTRYN